MCVCDLPSLTNQILNNSMMKKKGKILFGPGERALERLQNHFFNRPQNIHPLTITIESYDWSQRAFCRRFGQTKNLLPQSFKHPQWSCPVPILLLQKELCINQ